MSDIEIKMIFDLYFNGVLFYFLIANLTYCFILVLGYLNSRKKYTDKVLAIDRRLNYLKSLPPISIIIPCFNEQETIIDSLHSMLQLDYSGFEVICVNDGSTDDSLKRIDQEFELVEISRNYPQELPSSSIKNIYRSKKFRNLSVINKTNGGKSDALNAGINMSQFPLICCVDSDSLLDPKGLIRVALPFLEDRNHVIATGGTILPITMQHHINSKIPFSWYYMIQSIEYLRAFMVGRMGWDYLDSTTVISGAFGLFKKSLVIKCGGYRKETIGEDMELLVRMQKYCFENEVPFKIRLLPDPVCWTEPPTDLVTLKNQRIRWMQGLVETLWEHKSMIFNPKAKRVGLIGLPYQLLYEVLSAPLEIIGYFVAAAGVYLGIFESTEIYLLFMLTIVFGIVLNIGAIFVDQFSFQKFNRPVDVFKLCLGAIIEHFGFRQLHLWWRMIGIFRFLVGKQAWGVMKRKGSL